MKHLNDEEIVLLYYGESDEGGAHLEECQECAARYASLVHVLDAVDALPLPERGPQYPQEVWQRIERDVAASRRARWPLTAPWRWAAATAAAAVLLIGGFLAGRHSVPAPKQESIVAADPLVGERVLLVAVADHLERSQMVLVELANANPKFDSKGNLNISSEQERAEELVTENRLYRQTAQYTGQTAVAGVLDELERVLLDIAHTPSEISPQELEGLRQRLQSEGILFKIRVLRSNVGMQQQPAPRERL
jgi:hypothetical protein